MDKVMKSDKFKKLQQTLCNPDKCKDRKNAEKVSTKDSGNTLYTTKGSPKVLQNRLTVKSNGLENLKDSSNCLPVLQNGFNCQKKREATKNLSNLFNRNPADKAETESRYSFQPISKGMAAPSLMQSNNVFQRDNSGFLKPINPVQQRKSFEVELMEKAILKMNDYLTTFCECPLFDEVERLYHLEKWRIYLTGKIPKQSQMSNVESQEVGLLQDKISRINSWIQSSQSCGGEMVAHNATGDISMSQSYRPTNVQNILHSTSLEETNKDVNQKSLVTEKDLNYLLKDWTIVKGNNKQELFVSGTLIDMITRNVIELNHTSRKIVQALENNTVKTNSCTYHLRGQFLDQENCIPSTIKSYFRSGKFPTKYWKQIAEKWHKMSSMNGMDSIHKASKRALAESEEDLGTHNVKRRKLVPMETPRPLKKKGTCLNGSNVVPTKNDSRNFRDSLIVTRSVTRKNKAASRLLPPLGKKSSLMPTKTWKAIF